MQLADIQELGRAALALKILADQLTDETLKDKTIRQASLVMDAHDELLTAHRTKEMVGEASANAVANFANQNEAQS